MAGAQAWADALVGAGYTGDLHKALTVIGCESSGNETSRNSLGCWGGFQFCPSNSEYGNVNGNPSLDVQAQAFVRASGNGTNWAPWVASQHCWGSGGGDAFAAGVTGGTARTGGGGGDSGFVGDILGYLRDAISKSLGDFFHRDTLGAALLEWMVRAAELIAGVVLLAIGALMFLDVVSTPSTREGSSIVRSALRKVKQGAETAAAIAIVK